MVEPTNLLANIVTGGGYSLGKGILVNAASQIPTDLIARELRASGQQEVPSVAETVGGSVAGAVVGTTVFHALGKILSKGTGSIVRSLENGKTPSDAPFKEELQVRNSGDQPGSTYIYTRETNPSNKSYYTGEAGQNALRDEFGGILASDNHGVINSKDIPQNRIKIRDKANFLDGEEPTSSELGKIVAALMGAEQPKEEMSIKEFLTSEAENGKDVQALLKAGGYDGIFYTESHPNGLKDNRLSLFDTDHVNEETLPHEPDKVNNAMGDAIEAEKQGISFEKSDFIPDTIPEEMKALRDTGMVERELKDAKFLDEQDSILTAELKAAAESNPELASHLEVLEKESAPDADLYDAAKKYVSSYLEGLCEL